MRTSSFFVLLFSLGLFVAGCAPAGETTRQSQRGAVTQSQIEASGVSTNAYDILQNLRPEWLTTMRGEPVIYVDNVRHGNSVQSLRNISAQNIGRIERMTSTQASNRFGPGHLAGAILVTTR